jgi:hypothetical protein
MPPKQTSTSHARWRAGVRTGEPSLARPGDTPDRA